MSTVTVSELEAFHQFLGERLKSGRCKCSVEESVHEFRAYQRELERLREEIRPALERSLRGESKPFDPEELKGRITPDLAEHGILE